MVAELGTQVKSVRRAWNEKTAALCLDELANTYNVGLSLEVRQYMCCRLRCCIPHHVQMLFDRLHDHLRRESRQDVSVDDVDRVYLNEMLGVRGQTDLQHYEGRLKTILGETGYPIALEILTHTATQGRLDDETLSRYEQHFSILDGVGTSSVKHVMHVLYHDGYIERLQGNASQFVSRLLEDWWRNRYGQNFVSAVKLKQQDR